MKLILTFLTPLIITVSAIGQSTDKQFETLISQCTGINSGNYKCVSYIKLAGYIQSLSKSKAIELLKDYAKTGKYEDQIIVITKMMFKAKVDKSLRRPLIGAANFLGGTSYKDWPDEPIEIIKNTPFLITNGYSLGGVAESALKYLEYCIQNGEWTSNIYNVSTEKELKIALNILLDSKKWQKELSELDKKFFENQIN